MGKSFLLLFGLLSAPLAFADPSPTCYCSKPYHPFGSGPDATAWNQIIPGGHTYCFKDANATTEDDTAGNFRPCEAAPTPTSTAPQNQVNTATSVPTGLTTSRAIEVSVTGDNPSTGTETGVSTSVTGSPGSLAFNLHLTSMNNCEEKLKTLTAINPVFSISGGPAGTGAITEEQQKPYCQKLFPAGTNSGSYDVVVAATATFQDEPECEAKISSALGVSTSVEYADSSGKLLPVPDAVTYCKTIYPAVRLPRVEVSNIQ